MPDYEFVTVDVFTEERFGGNPLAVFPDARGLTGEQMQALAREFNLSETTFVLPPQDPRHTAQVRIFTPQHEMPFAGHPNVGTGTVLAWRMDDPPEHLVFEEIAGLVRVHVQRGPDGAITGTRIAAPHSLQFGASVPAMTVGDCIGLPEAAIATGLHDPVVASVGAPFVIAELADLGLLAAAEPNIPAFRAAAGRFPDLSERFNLLLYVRIDGDATRLATRMFAPLTGVMEDPATGSANAALAALLTSLAPGEDVDLHYDIVQGVEMGRPSRLLASARKTAEGPVGQGDARLGDGLRRALTLPSLRDGPLPLPRCGRGAASARPLALPLSRIAGEGWGEGAYAAATISASARPTSSVPAWPPMSRVRGPLSRSSVSMAATIAAAASASPSCSSIIAADQIWPIGLQMCRPAMSGAEPCTGSNIDG
jgi:trans-2,3-dihydro-3-hydroxyanthranilate isomerase